MNETKFKVGDEVIVQGRTTIGKVVKISDKRKDLTVDFGGRTEVFDYRGWDKNGDKWYRYYIVLVDDAAKKKLEEYRIINKATIIIHRWEKEGLSPDVAKKIIQIEADLRD